MSKPRFYFAYGSNLHRGQFARRCPASKPVGKLILPDWQLVFRGPADIEHAPGAKVHGAVYQITPDCEAALDRYEGYPRMYTKAEFTARITAEGQEPIIAPVMVYIMVDANYLAEPSDGYFKIIEEGYGHWEWDAKPLHIARKRTRKRIAKLNDRDADLWKGANDGESQAQD